MVNPNEVPVSVDGERVLPSAEVYREMLLAVYEGAGEDGLAALLFNITEHVGPESDWIIHALPTKMVCCHIHADAADDDAPVWQAEGPTLGEAMLLVIEDYVDSLRVAE